MVFVGWVERSVSGAFS